jgi:predicted metal-dependent enzyme (double-stranded beta helix superfamily)
MSSQEDSIDDFKKLVVLPFDEPSNAEEALLRLPGLRKLVQEYYDLATSKELSEADTKRISEIFELAQYDELLDEWIAKVDEAVEITEQIKSKQLSIEEFIDLVERIPLQEMTLEKFQSLAERLYLSDKFLQKYISFKDDDYHRKLIFQTSFGCVYVIAWKPGQSTTIHPHCNDISVIRVCQGKLTHQLFEKVEHLYGQKGYRPKQEKQFTQNQWVCVDFSQIHQLSNESNENLVTLHFRFFQKTIAIDECLPLDSQLANSKEELYRQKRCKV